ncbi:two-component system, sensor histidine kinase YesM [Paenibacillus catalpae]|uniref:histidine kinase n=1 Tax=Paenibacillus catalpae TaxID=1045775 RepID=A0A1I1SXN7_9BACL|nr:sensor histidine kinase [Paenibacillus catalpae]SFD51207.1 two-component system, sensor histidine kinase YesM [Paenibacillus catalpae]
MTRLRTVIFWRIVIVAAVSFLLSIAFTYYYYNHILIGQMMQEDKAKLSQTVRQLDYMSDDISKFTFTLIIAEQLQEFYKTYDQLDTFDQFKALQSTFKFVDGYKGLRKEVTSYALVLPDGRAFWNAAGNDDYFSERLKESWYLNFVLSGTEYGFTEPHLMFADQKPTSETTIISYVVTVRDIEKPGRTIGKFIVNLDYSHFQSLLDFSPFAHLAWLSDSGNSLYTKPSDKQLAHLVHDLEDAANNEGAFRVNNGYLLVDRFETSGWRLATFISQSSLFDRAKIVLYLLGFFTLVSTTLILVLMIPAILRITRPIMRLYNAMNAVSSGNLQTSVQISTGDEMEKLGNGFNRMTSQLRTHIEESIQHEKDKRELQMELLLSQLNPHFIYNTLNAVIYMAQKQGNEDIVRMVAAFIRVLQDAVRTGGDDSLVPLRDEVALLKDYIEIQSYRYADMFKVEWALEEESLHCLVPRIMIQPFFENAIFHGICPKDEPGTIRITANESDSLLLLTIEDDGIGIEPERLEEIWETHEKKSSPGLRHIGLNNTKRRLEHLFGSHASIQIDSEVGQGTRVSIRLPKLNQNNL